MTEDKLAKYIEFCNNNGFKTDENSNQRKAVLGNHYSVIPAGAGSGKTTVLTFRFLRLIMDDEIERIHSDEILTITFTKAATANMRKKIYRILKKAETEGLINSEEIERFSNAEISTTDSFCSKIVRSDCTRYGISPSFRIEDDNDFREFVKTTLKEIVENSLEAGNEPLETILGIKSFESSGFSDDSLLSGFTDVAFNYIDISNPYLKDSNELYEKIVRETLEIIRKETEKRKEELIRLLERFTSCFGAYKSIQDDIVHCASIMSFVKDGTEITTKFSNGNKTVKEDKSRQDEFRKQKAEIKAALDLYEECLKFSEGGPLENLRAYAPLLTEFQDRIIRHKREEGVLSFHDVMLLAIDILKTNPSLRAFYNKRFKKIMVDEFQDNNEENKRLIYLLAAKPEFQYDDRYPEVDDIILDKVFMVGDEKQSIYRFRGADVSVFKNISKDFGDEKVLALSENFRSESSLIKNVNRIFDGRIMPEKSEFNPEYEAEYTPLTSSNNRIESSISFRYMNTEKIDKDSKKDYLSNDLCEGYEVARIIREEILGKDKEKYRVWDKHTKSLRYPEYDDIAILLKKSTHQSSFEKGLRYYNIPFNVTDNKSLTMDAVMNDFYSILQYSVYGDDDQISFAAVLRSPFVNMSDQDIEKVLLNRKKEKDIKNEPAQDGKDISDELSRDENDISEGLSQDGKVRLKILRKLVDDIHEKEKRESLTSLVHFLWFDCGYRYYIETESKNESYSEHFDYIFSIAADFDSNGKGIIELLDRIRPSLGDISDFKDLNVLSEEKTGVTIQTIHKSKGLEYPIVFVSDMGGENKGGRFDIARLPSGLPLLPYYICLDQYKEKKLRNPVKIVSKAEEKQIENAETKRVLYVAATRSEYHLIFTSVFGYKSFHKDKKTNKRVLTEVNEESSNTMLQYFIKGIDFNLEENSAVIDTEEFYPVRRADVFRKAKKEKKENADTIEKWYEEPQKPKADDGRQKLGVTTLIAEDPVRPDEIIPLPSVRADRILSTVSGETDEEKEAAKEERITSFGTLVHLLLENYVLGEETDTSSFFPDDRDRETIIESAYDLRDNFLSSDFRKTLDGYTLHPEKEFLIQDGNNTVEGIIDLMCVSPDKVIIVDYKTDSIKAPERHRAQLGYYRKALSTIYSGREIETWLFYLRSAEAVKID